MRVYYNEIDRYCCQWLHNLMREGLIPEGDIDDRDIREVQPSDLEGYDQCHFFAGIAGWAYALELAGWDGPVWTGSCPCQPFSAAGQRKAGTDERHLWPDWLRLIGECRPHTVFGEQVEGAVGLGWLDRVFADLEAQDYACGAAVLGAHSVGAPHIRQRLWWVADAGSQRIQQRPAKGYRAPPRAQGKVGERQRGREHTESRRQNGGLAHAPGPELQGLASARHQRGNGEDEDAGGLAYTGSNGHTRRDITPTINGGRPREGAEQGREPAPCGALLPSGLGNTSRNGREGQRDGRNAKRQARHDPWSASAGGRGADWLYCEFDQKWRRTPSGVPLLAHGIPNRVARLRAYGNSICPATAAEFVRAVMET